MMNVSKPPFLLQPHDALLVKECHKTLGVRLHSTLAWWDFGKAAQTGKAENKGACLFSVNKNLSREEKHCDWTVALHKDYLWVKGIKSKNSKQQRSHLHKQAHGPCPFIWVWVDLRTPLSPQRWVKARENFNTWLFPSCLSQNVPCHWQVPYPGHPVHRGNTLYNCRYFKICSDCIRWCDSWKKCF